MRMSLYYECLGSTAILKYAPQEKGSLDLCELAEVRLNVDSQPRSKDGALPEPVLELHTPQRVCVTAPCALPCPGHTHTHTHTHATSLRARRWCWCWC